MPSSAPWQGVTMSFTAHRLDRVARPVDCVETFFIAALCAYGVERQVGADDDPVNFHVGFLTVPFCPVGACKGGVINRVFAVQFFDGSETGAGFIALLGVATFEVR